MKKLLLATVVTLIGFSATVSPSNAMARSKYCMHYNYDPLCMSPKMMKMRMEMMKMTKSMVMADRKKYCMNNGNNTDPICSPKMMHSTMGF
jgi:hypothetical protein